MNKRIIYLVLTFFAVFLIPVGIQTINMNTENHYTIKLASEPEPPTLPEISNYIYHESIIIDLETWDDVIEEFDGLGTKECPLIIKGFYFEYNDYGQSSGIFINSDVEEAYIDIENCLYIETTIGVLSYPSSGRIRIKDCTFIGNVYGVYFGMHAEHVVKDCLFYEGSVAGVFLEEAYDVTIKNCNFYLVEIGVFVSWHAPTSRLEIDGCTFSNGINGIYFHSAVTGPNGAVLIHDSEFGWYNENLKSSAIYLTGGSTGIVIDDNYIHDCEYGIWLQQNESYNRISSNLIEYCPQAIWIEGLSPAYEARGNEISNNEIAHISREAVWFHRYTTENIFIGNYLHDNEIGDAEQYNMFIQGHHNIIKLNKFENLGTGLVAITLYSDIWYPYSYENEIMWNVFLDTDVMAISNFSGDNLIDYNYYADYEGDGVEPYVNQDLHPLGPELSSYFWLNLFFEYPREVWKMWKLLF